MQVRKEGRNVRTYWFATDLQGFATEWTEARNGVDRGSQQCGPAFIRRNQVFSTRLPCYARLPEKQELRLRVVMISRSSQFSIGTVPPTLSGSGDESQNDSAGVTHRAAGARSYAR